MSKSSEKEPTSGTFSMADLVTHCAGGLLNESCGERTSQIFIQKHSAANLPWPRGPLHVSTLLLQSPCLLWFLSHSDPSQSWWPALLPISGPLFNFFLSVLCILLTLVLPYSFRQRARQLPPQDTLSVWGWVGPLHFPLGRKNVNK